MNVSKNKILLLIAEKGLNQSKLADKANMSRGTLSVIMNGKSCRPETVLRLANALDVSINSIIEN